MFIISNKYIVAEIYRQSNKKELDQFTEWLNIQEGNVNSGVGNAQSIAPAYYIHRDLDIFMLNGEKIPTYLVLIDNHKYDNFMKDKFIYHWGDSKYKNNRNSADDFSGNKIFRLIHELKALGTIDLLPTILYFDKPKSGKLIFKGICVLEDLFLVPDFEYEEKIIPNYLAKLKLTKDKEIELIYLHQRALAKKVEELQVNIPEGLRKEITRLKNTNTDMSIKTLTLSDYVNIKGGSMEEQNNLQNNISEKEIASDTENLNSELGDTNNSNDTLSGDLEDISDSSDNLDTENISYWLFALDTLDTHFSRIDTSREVSYEISFSSALDGDINPQKNDLIIGYMSNPSSSKLLKYVFKITDVLAAEEEEEDTSSNQPDLSIAFKKLFETSVDIDVNSISSEAPKTYSSIQSTNEINRFVAKIPYTEFNFLIKFMLESLTSSLFKTDNTTEANPGDNFDILKNIDDQVKLNNIKDSQNTIDDPIRNKIVYGAPGTGKSHKVNNFKDKFFADEFLFERVTFHPSYTYGQFVGSYKPSPIYSKDESKTISWYSSDRKKDDTLMNPHIDYTLVAGPFLNMLCKALNNPDYNFLLIIEEMNRANAAAVFGDVFQLLDRGNENISTYKVKFNADITNFLVKNIKNDVDKNLFNKDTGFVKIPKNLFIWGTMNSADEGVSKMDSAFKRRWSFEYTDINPIKDSKKYETVTKLAMYIPFLYSGKGAYIPWNTFRENLNEVLYDINKMLPEDKYIGPFFLNENELLDKNVIKSKLLLYLKDDVLKHSSDKLFNDFRFSSISRNFDKENVFKDNYIDTKYLESIVIKDSEFNNYSNLNNSNDLSSDTEE